MTFWKPTNLSKAGPRYLAIVKALEDDLASGRLESGAKLLPHRELAYQLKVSVGTISRAYKIAGERGLIEGEVGRGTYVRTSPGAEGKFFGDGQNDLGPIDLSLNQPPLGTQEQAVVRGLASMFDTGQLGSLLQYLPHRGLLSHRQAIARWIARFGFEPSAEQIAICHGAQHAMAVVTGVLVRQGETVLAEELTYAGMKAIANYHSLRLKGVSMDAEGIRPEALATACERYGARLLYIMPTLQNPTATIASQARRVALAEVIREHKLFVVEDDVYGFLCPGAPPPLATLVPELTFYVGSFSKCVAPGLRLGFVASPVRYVDAIANGVRATAWMATPIMSELVSRLLDDGTVHKLAEEKRTEAIARLRIAERCLGPSFKKLPQASFHYWLALPPIINPSNFVLEARSQNVIVTPPDAIIAEQSDTSPNWHGVRLCLGAAENRTRLESGLTILRDLIEYPGRRSLSFV